MMVYHGSPNTFGAIAISDGMIWLCANKDYAAEFGHVRAYRIHLTNPLDMSSATEELPLECWQSILRDLGIDIDAIDWDIVDFAPDYGYYYFYDLLPHAGNNYANAGTLDAIVTAGYDGIIAPPEWCNDICSESTYVVFSSDCLEEVK
jgi:hypothetical protein